MDEFDASWLALREPYDHAARADDALGFMAPVLADTIRVLDLGTGSGSNFRHLSPKLEAEQRWRLTDKDERLLSVARRYRCDHPNVKDFAVERIDLATSLGALDLKNVDLVTGSALVDLVSYAWLRSFVSMVAAERVPALLFTLSVDGHVQWTPRDPFDDAVGGFFGRHMVSDKGFGNALGYHGWECLASLLSDAGYDVRTYESPWHLGTGDTEIQHALLEGYVGASVATEPTQKDEIRAWETRRSRAIDEGKSGLMVGHRDVCAVFPDKSR